MSVPEIKDVIFNDPAVIVLWKDGTKTVVKASDEAFDPEKGLAMAYTKKILGNKGNYFNEIKKWVEKYEEKESYGNTLARRLADALEPLSKITNPIKKEKADKTLRMTVQEYGERFNLSDNAVRKMCRDGVLNCAKDGRGRWVIFCN